MSVDVKELKAERKKINDELTIAKGKLLEYKNLVAELKVKKGEVQEQINKLSDK